jgi:hypothetical protein
LIDDAICEAAQVPDAVSEDPDSSLAVSEEVTCHGKVSRVATEEDDLIHRTVVHQVDEPYTVSVKRQVDYRVTVEVGEKSDIVRRTVEKRSVHDRGTFIIVKEELGSRRAMEGKLDLNTSPNQTGA